MKRRHAVAAFVATATVMDSARAQPRPSTAQPNVQVLAERLAMPGLNRERGLRLYLPPSYASEPARRYPVIYLHDGQNLFDDATSFSGEWGVDETLNELARTAGFEAIAVGIDNGGALRTQEMLPWPNPPRFAIAEGDAYADFVVRTVKPSIDARYRTNPQRERSAIIGSSMGGLISHHIALRHPGVFARIGVFSPAYWLAPRIFEETARQALAPGTRVYLYAGTDESDSLVGEVRRMQAILRAQRGVDVNVSIVPGARHNEAAWRTELGRALRWLFEIG